MMLEATLALKATQTARDGPIALNAFCDWLEASLLFGESSSLSLPEVVELLVEEELCDCQAEAWTVVADAKRQLHQRARLLRRGYPVAIGDTRLRRKSTWRQVPAYAFCLLL